ncbi:MAG: thiopurine S-methyltransferase, partial [Gammaproteobacteria bacterium]
DIFALQREHVENTAAVYDRAALIALPAELRAAYVEHLSAILPAHVEWLIITLEYPPHDLTGPPFAVYEDELRQLFAGHRRIRRLKSRDILDEEPRLRGRGATALSEHIFKLD